MTSFYDERRADRAAQAAERRSDLDHKTKLRRDERRADREEQRAEKARRRRDHAQRRALRAQRRQKALTPGNVYRRGTLLLVALSALASLPAQIRHFVDISWMLAPIGPAVEGAAWILAAGVAYADERKLPMWVRWLLRGFSLAAAGFAANVNYDFGTHLTGLTHEQQAVAGLGLAAVTLGGPLLFEVRQWVITLSAKTVSPQQRAATKAKAKMEKAQRKHAQERRKQFEVVAGRQKQLLLAAPHRTITEEEAWARAWADVHGAPLGVTAASITARLTAEQSVAAALKAAERSPEAVAVDLLLADIFSPGPEGDGTTGGAPKDGPLGGPHGVGDTSTLTLPGGASEDRPALDGKGKQAPQQTADDDADRPLDEGDLDRVRALAAVLGGANKLSAKKVRELIGCRASYAVRLRNHVQSEER